MTFKYEKDAVKVSNKKDLFYFKNKSKERSQDVKFVVCLRKNPLILSYIVHITEKVPLMA